MGEQERVPLFFRSETRWFANYYLIIQSSQGRIFGILRHLANHIIAERHYTPGSLGKKIWSFRGHTLASGRPSRISNLDFENRGLLALTRDWRV